MEYTTTHARLLLLLLISLLLPATALAQRRVALVIGIAAYTDAPLRNPLNDAQDMAKALRDLGFEVIEVTNATKKMLLDAVNDFGARIQRAHVGLFYYSGHGVQYQGKNYLIPVQTVIGSPADLEQEAVDAGRIVGRMEQSQVALSLVILDACRNNPFRNLMAFRSYGERGLAAIAPPVRGSLVAYATQPDNVAADGTGRNGTYTKHLLQYLKQPGLSLPTLFNEVGLAVSKETQGAQVPWMNFSPLPAFCFAGCEPSPTPGVPAPPVAPPPTPPAPALAPIIGLWEQYFYDHAGKLAYGGTFRVVQQKNTYRMYAEKQPKTPFIINSLGLFDVEYSSGVWTFKSDWGNGDIGHFVLKRVSDTVFEGESLFNGKAPKTKNKWVKIQ
jgi:hypothetical protein